MDIQKIKQIIKLVENAQIHALKVTSDDTTIEITKSQAPAPVSHDLLHQLAQQPVSVQTAPAAQATAPEPDPVPEKEAVGNLITSPMVGTVYLSPKPDEPDYISVGASVNKGDIVCLIEAMKLFNDIESEFSGEVKEILVKNGQVVDYGQPLFRVI